MTLEEMQVVTSICGTADGGCGGCVEALVDQLQEAFPAFAFRVTNEWGKSPSGQMGLRIDVREVPR